MTDDKYNGWSNRKTWDVMLWLDNHERKCRYWREQAKRHREEAPSCKQVQQGFWNVKEAAQINLAEQLREEVCEDSPLSDANLYTDLLNVALSEVNWREVAENMLIDLNTESGEE